MTKVETQSISVATKDSANDYLAKDIVRDWSALPMHEKLTIFQKTPKKFIKERSIPGNDNYAYISHGYAEKVLNFIFNFQVSNEIIKSEYLTSTNSKGKKVIECECVVKFIFGRGENQIIRTVIGTHKGYENPAICRGDVMKAALSQAWVKVAQTFGIGTELERANENHVQEEEPKTTNEKDFGLSY